MNFEPGNQEGEERAVSLILFAFDSACRCKSEGENESACTRARHRANWLSVSAERNFKAQSFGRIQPRNSTRIIRRLVGPFLHTLALRDRERNKRAISAVGFYVLVRVFHFVDLKKC